MSILFPLLIVPALFLVLEETRWPFILMDLGRIPALESEILSILAMKFLLKIIIFLKSNLLHEASCDFDLHSPMFSEFLHFLRLYRLPCIYRLLLPTPGGYVSSLDPS